MTRSAFRFLPLVLVAAVAIPAAANTVRHLSSSYAEQFNTATTLNPFTKVAGPLPTLSNHFGLNLSDFKNGKFALFGSDETRYCEGDSKESYHSYCGGSQPYSTASGATVDVGAEFRGLSGFKGLVRDLTAWLSSNSPGFNTYSKLRKTDTRVRHVPEPGSLTLICAGLAGIPVLRRRTGR